MQSVSWLAEGLTLRPTSQGRNPASACYCRYRIRPLCSHWPCCSMSMVLDHPCSTNTAYDTTLVRVWFSSTPMSQRIVASGLSWVGFPGGRLWGKRCCISSSSQGAEKWGRTEAASTGCVEDEATITGNRAQSTWGRTSCCPIQGQGVEPLLIQGPLGDSQRPLPSHIRFLPEVLPRAAAEGLLTPG